MTGSCGWHATQCRVSASWSSSRCSQIMAKSSRCCSASPLVAGSCPQAGQARVARALAAGSLMRAWIGCGSVASSPGAADGVLHVLRHECRTSLSANCGRWHAPPVSVSAMLTLAPGCSPWRLRRQWRHSGCRHGRWRRGRPVARKEPADMGGSERSADDPLAVHNWTIWARPSGSRDACARCMPKSDVLIASVQVGGRSWPVCRTAATQPPMQRACGSSSAQVGHATGSCPSAGDRCVRPAARRFPPSRGLSLPRPQRRFRAGVFECPGSLAGGRLAAGVRSPERAAASPAALSGYCPSLPLEPLWYKSKSKD